MSIIKIKNARLSYPFIFAPRARSKSDGSTEEKYEAVVVLPSDHDVGALHQAVLNTAIEKWGKDVTGKLLKAKRLKQPLRTDEDQIESQGYGDSAGYFTASSRDRIGVVSVYPDPEDPSRPAKITDPEEIYPGVRVNVAVRPFAWEHPEGGKGVSFSLEAIQKVGDDDRFDSKIKAQDFFDIDPDALMDINDALGGANAEADPEAEAEGDSEDDSLLGMLGGS